MIILRISLLAAAVSLAAPCDAQQGPAETSLQMSIVVDAPVEKVWARIGKYCDIGEWGFRGCDLISGKEGEIGAVRTIGHSVIVGQTRYSYTYTQPLRATGLYPMYHGTLEARPLGSGRTTLYRWTLNGCLATMRSLRNQVHTL
jgi:hypothetical protein